MAPIEVDTTGTRYTVGSAPRPENDMEGRQRQDRQTGVPQFTTWLVKIDDEGTGVRPVGLIAIRGTRASAPASRSRPSDRARARSDRRGVLIRPGRWRGRD